MLEHPPVLARYVELVADQVIECVSHLGQTRVHRQFASPKYVAFQERLFILSLAPFSLQARLTMNCFPVILTYKTTKDTRSTIQIWITCEESLLVARKYGEYTQGGSRLTEEQFPTTQSTIIPFTKVSSSMHVVSFVREYAKLAATYQKILILQLLRHGDSHAYNVRISRKP